MLKTYAGLVLDGADKYLLPSSDGVGPMPINHGLVCVFASASCIVHASLVYVLLPASFPVCYLQMLISLMTVLFERIVIIRVVPII